MSEALDSQLKFTESGGQGWWIASGTDDEYYYEADAAQSDYDLPDTGGETCLQAIVDSDSSQTVKFYWKVSSEQSHDYLQFYIDSTLKDQISGEVGWQQKSYAVSSGIHTLKWRYVKDGSGQSGDDCGWVDFVQWTGPSPAQDPANWQEIAYKHDVAGRRVEKKVDGYSTRYVHDGGHVIAEYDGNNNLLRKYIYGPCTDEPISMIEVTDSNAAYYYHFDALGSVVALSDASGNTVQTYEYSVYGEVAVEDANHTNPYMFTGVRYDIEIGLYYNRARYYNPFTGRFLQTDPVGYKDGMNWYSYCGNNPLNFVDPSGTMTLRDFNVTPQLLLFWYFFGGGNPLVIKGIGVDAFIHSDVVWREHMRDALSGYALSCLLRARDTGETEGDFSFDGIGRTDSSHGSSHIEFDESFTIENLANWAFHISTVSTMGSYKVNLAENSVTINVRFVIQDKMDFEPYIPLVKPEGYGIDTMATLATIAWNYATTIGKYRKAQPYEIRLESSEWSTTFYFNDVNDLIRVTGFLGFWER